MFGLPSPFSLEVSSNEIRKRKAGSGKRGQPASFFTTSGEEERSVFERAADQTVSRASNPQYRVTHQANRKGRLLAFHKMLYFSVFFSF